ncbi:MAG: hypothetical protein NTZ85_09635 [Bacteroidia bacterium]|jgi:hypothetical protein|nr:hypothetical protein [Bacteroidia bacterium]
MKALNWIAWTSACIGVLIILLGVISGLIGKSILPIQHVVNYFHVANSFFLITIALFVFLFRCQCKKE